MATAKSSPAERLVRLCGGPRGPLDAQLLPAVALRFQRLQAALHDDRRELGVGHQRVDLARQQPLRAQDLRRRPVDADGLVVLLLAAARPDERCVGRQVKGLEVGVVKVAVFGRRR